MSYFKNKITYETYEAYVAFQELDHLWNRPANRSGCPRGPRTPSPRGRSRSSWTWSCPASRPRGRSSAASPSSTCSAPLRLFDYLAEFFDNLTLKIPNRFSAILAKKPQKVIIDCAAFSSTCTIYVQYFWLYYKCMYYQLCMNIMIQMIYLRNYFFSNIKRSRIVILYQTCVACKAWVTNLQVLQEWQKIPPEDKASLWTINLSI